MNGVDRRSIAGVPENGTYRHDALPRPAIQPRRASLLLVGEHTAAAALREGSAVVIGRAPPADLVLADRSLSRVHARVTWEGESLLVEDLESTNGVFVDGERVQSVSIAPGHEVLLGSVRLVAHLSSFVGARERAGEEAFQAHLERELVRARTFRRTFAVFAIRRSDASETGWIQGIAASLRRVDALVQASAEVALACIAEPSPRDLESWAARFRASMGGREIRVGAALYPEHAEQTEALVHAALEALANARGTEVGVPRPSRAEPETTPSVIVESAPMKALYGLVARVARTRMPILVLGETGVGKELVARAIHDSSPRARGPFRALNCATIPANLTESTLFGHEKGAFTGAAARAAGVFEQSGGGTVFLDEVGELPLPAQAALLRVIETGRITRVGGHQELEVDVRVVAATHRDLVAMVSEGTFREDLLYRLDAMTLEVPPLRERIEDVAPLAQAFLRHARAQWETPALDFHPAVLHAFSAYEWPGNVRQLRNAVSRAAAIALGPAITLEDLPRDIASTAGQGRSPEEASASPSGGTLTERVDAFEREILRGALEKTRGSQSRAAELLGVPRRTLAHKVKRYGLA